jgi:peptidase E
MTKFILHGGMTSFRNENNKKFFQEIIKDLPQKPKILISLFSIDKSRWEEEFKYQKNNFIHNLGNLEFDFQLANKQEFLDQIEWADAVHFRGGNTLMLLESVKKFPDFHRKIENKTISGSSAGALFLVEKFYDQDHSKIIEGLGTLNINLITHYKSDKYPSTDKNVLEELKKSNNALILLKETEFKIFNK